MGRNASVNERALVRTLPHSRVSAQSVEKLFAELFLDTRVGDEPDEGDDDVDRV